MIKPSNVCVLMMLLNLAIAFYIFVAQETETISQPVSGIAGIVILAFLIGLYYLREFAKRAEKKLGWN